MSLYHPPDNDVKSPMVVSAAIVVTRMIVFADDGFVIPSFGPSTILRIIWIRSKEGIAIYHRENISKIYRFKITLIERLAYSVNHLLTTSYL